MTQEIETRPRRRLNARTSLIAAAMLGIGVAGGATAIHLTGPRIEMAPTQPVAIGSLKDDGGIVTLRGRVAEVYGPMFVLADGSGKALIDGGPHEAASPVAAGAPVTVQGRYRDGVVRASFLVGADGKVVALGGPGHDRHGPGREERDGPRHEGRDGPPPGDRDQAPPPPAPAAPAPIANSAG